MCFMFGLLKTIVWIAGAIIIASFVLGYFGYEINWNYFKESKANCQAEITKCGEEFLEQGTKNANCDFTCVDPKLIIKKK
jgi:hypothetical protein